MSFVLSYLYCLRCNVRADRLVGIFVSQVILTEESWLGGPNVAKALILYNADDDDDDYGYCLQYIQSWVLLGLKAKGLASRYEKFRGWIQGEIVVCDLASQIFKAESICFTTDGKGLSDE